MAVQYEILSASEKSLSQAGKRIDELPGIHYHSGLINEATVYHHKRAKAIALMFALDIDVEYMTIVKSSVKL